MDITSTVFRTKQRRRHYEPLAQPFLKWAGGKRQLIKEIINLIPKKYNKYYEPFLGGGALLFYLQPSKTVVSDSNSDLINCYQVLRDSPDKLLEVIGGFKNEKDFFYKTREMDRQPSYAELSPVIKAARIIYLNKTCFNGLFRVNKQGQFNAPFGNYKNPTLLDPAVAKAVHKYLQKNEVAILNFDFEEAVSTARAGDFVYFDPPYDPISDTSSFTGYDLNGFSRSEQQRLKRVCDELTEQGVAILLSNSDTPFVRELYNDIRYTVHVVQARRSINSVGSKRGKINEVLVKNNVANNA